MPGMNDQILLLLLFLLASRAEGAMKTPDLASSFEWLFEFLGGHATWGTGKCV